MLNGCINKHIGTVQPLTPVIVSQLVTAVIYPQKLEALIQRQVAVTNGNATLMEEGEVLLRLAWRYRLRTESFGLQTAWTQNPDWNCPPVPKRFIPQSWHHLVDDKFCQMVIYKYFLSRNATLEWMHKTEILLQYYKHIQGSIPHQIKFVTECEGTNLERWNS